MTTRRTRLELTWIGKDERARLEPRILLEDPSLSHHAARRGPNDIFDNRLIFGDNLLALKALEQEFAGKVKCVFIDPPYNTGSAFAQYPDGLEHSLWLSMMRERLEALRRLLAIDGSLWITIDDNEAHYLKVIADEVFGRDNFVANCIWQKVYSERMDASGFSVSHDHILVYRKDAAFALNRLNASQNRAQFGYFDDRVGKYYRRRSLRKEGSESLREDRPSMWYPIPAPDASEVWPLKPDGTEGRWRWKQSESLSRLGELDFVRRDGRWEIYVKQFLADDPQRPAPTLWLEEEVGHNHEAKLEAKALNANDVFETPKPERLLERVFRLATVTGDLVLDSFAGSGTSGAVAHKMRRRWIMVEFGEHCHTHIIPRLKKVIDGEDPGGITESAGWQGGGGFRYYKVAPSLLQKDAWGNWIVNREFNAEMLAEAVCKLENFHYAPSSEIWWQHGHSTERDFIFVTTQALTQPQLAQISDEVGPDRTLLICCGSFRADTSAFSNLTVKKIPKAVLHRCEWGRDDYSLRIAGLPEAEPARAVPAEPAPRKRASPRKSPAAPTLFSLTEGDVASAEEPAEES